MYNIDFCVKYKTIEEELLEKIKNGEKDYCENDVFDICNELYRYELLSVFQVENLDNPLLEKNISEVWNIVKQNMDFMKIVETYRERIPLCSDLVDDKDFIGLLNYDTFFLVHKTICKCLQNDRIDKDLLDTVIEKIKQI